MDLFKDERFKHIAKDPKFRNVPRSERKIKIDKRFQAMFTDDKFKLKYSVDQRGRPIRHSQAEDLKKYYDLVDESSEEEEDQANREDKTEFGVKDRVKADDDSGEEPSDDKEETGDDLTTEESLLLKSSKIERSELSGKVLERLQDTSVDYARGEGLLVTDSSSSDEPTTDDSEEEIEHDWGELDKDAERTDEATSRLAVCHLDWDRVNATDIMVLLHSFLPPTGFIHTVTIYPSEFGLHRMKEEEIKGPQELTSKTLQVDTDDDDEQDSSEDEKDEYHREKLRQYQMKRLKYFYAVVEFDSADSANKVYTECDRMEYESSATKLDLRFIPQHMTFDQEAKEVCSSLPETGKYKPRLFANTALQQEKVELTWDETDPDRVDLSKRLAEGAPVSEADLRAYIATSSEESAEEHSSEDGDEGKDNKEGKEGKEDEISKYRSLLTNIQKEEEERKRGKVEMEISWDLELENKTRSAVQQAHDNHSLTPFQQRIKNKKETKKTNKKGSDSDNLLSDDDMPSDIDMNDPFFKDEFEDYPKKKKNNKNKKNSWNVKDIDDDADDEEKQRKAELELLLAEDEEEDPNRRHFSLKAIQDKEANKNKKIKGKKTENKTPNNSEQDNFKINLQDGRFDALFTSHHYNIDPTDSRFRKTKAMDDIIAEKSKRRRKNSGRTDFAESEKPETSRGPQLSSEVSQLLSSVKKKAKMNNKSF